MDATSTPLADYFWIAGVESITYDDVSQGQFNPKDHQVGSTIVEDGEPPDEASKDTFGRVSARHSRQSSGNRLSKLSFSDKRFSINTIDDLDGGNTASSNRSSATIRPVNNGSGQNGLTIPDDGNSRPASGGTTIEGFDFDRALLKFAAEREDFLEDLTFSAGAKVESRPPMTNPRAERIKAEDGEPSGRRSPLRSLRGSIRRRISFRDMNSMRKQPSTSRSSGTNRTCMFCPQSHASGDDLVPGMRPSWQAIDDVLT